MRGKHISHWKLPRLWNAVMETRKKAEGESKIEKQKEKFQQLQSYLSEILEIISMVIIKMLEKAVTQHFFRFSLILFHLSFRLSNQIVHQ